MLPSPICVHVISLRTHILCVQRRTNPRVLGGAEVVVRTTGGARGALGWSGSSTHVGRGGVGEEGDQGCLHETRCVYGGWGGGNVYHTQPVIIARIARFVELALALDVGGVQIRLSCGLRILASEACHSTHFEGGLLLIRLSSRSTGYTKLYRRENDWQVFMTLMSCCVITVCRRTMEGSVAVSVGSREASEEASEGSREASEDSRVATGDFPEGTERTGGRDGVGVWGGSVGGEGEREGEEEEEEEEEEEWEAGEGVSGASESLKGEVEVTRGE